MKINLTQGNIEMKLEVHAVDECSQTSNGTLGGRCLIHWPFNRLIRRRKLDYQVLTNPYSAKMNRYAVLRSRNTRGESHVTTCPDPKRSYAVSSQQNIRANSRDVSAYTQAKALRYAYGDYLRSELVTGAL